MIKSAKASSARALRAATLAVQPENLCKYRLLRPIAHRLHDPVYWSTDTKSMTIGVSTGLLWAFWLPIGQIVVACFQSVLLRGNLPAAAAATFVSNPFTLGPLSYVAHQIGSFILGAQSLAQIPPATQAQLVSASFVDTMHVHVANLGLPWLVGMFAMGPLASIAGLLLTPLVLYLLSLRA